MGFLPIYNHHVSCVCFYMHRLRIFFFMIIIIPFESFLSLAHSVVALFARKRLLKILSHTIHIILSKWYKLIYAVLCMIYSPMYLCRISAILSIEVLMAYWPQAITKRPAVYIVRPVEAVIPREVGEENALKTHKEMQNTKKKIVYTAPNITHMHHDVLYKYQQYQWEICKKAKRTRARVMETHKKHTATEHAE